MRIGTNHGSLSDRIMSYYGDSPRGMVKYLKAFKKVSLLTHELVVLPEFCHTG